MHIYTWLFSSWHTQIDTYLLLKVEQNGDILTKWLIDGTIPMFWYGLNMWECFWLTTVEEFSKNRRITVIWHITEAMQGELKIKQRAQKQEKRAVTNNDLSAMSVSYVSTQNDLCDLARCISRSLKVTKENYHHSSHKQQLYYDVPYLWKLSTSILHCIIWCMSMTKVCWQVLTQTAESLDVTSTFAQKLFC